MFILQTESLGHHSAVMQSSIDQGPYLNVADGMVAAMGNERTDAPASETSEDQNLEENNTVPVTVNHEITSGRTSSEGCAKRSGIVEKCFYQLSRQNKKSIWLLAYIALLSSWPIVGAALGYFLGKRFKRGIPGKLQK